MTNTLCCDLGVVHPGPYAEYLYKYNSQDRQGMLCESCAKMFSAWKKPERKKEGKEHVSK